MNSPVDFEKTLCVATVKLFNKILGNYFKNKVIYFEEIVVFGSLRIFFTTTHIYKCEFISLNLRKCIICVCMHIYIHICSHTCTHTLSKLTPSPHRLQHTRKYMLSLPYIPFLNFTLTQIGSVTNFKLEVLKIRSDIQSLKSMDMCWAPNY